MSSLEANPHSRYSLASTATVRDSHDAPARPAFDDDTTLLALSVPEQHPPTPPIIAASNTAHMYTHSTSSSSPSSLAKGTSEELARPSPAHTKPLPQASLSVSGPDPASAPPQRPTPKPTFSSSLRTGPFGRKPTFDASKANAEPKLYRMPLRKLEGGPWHHWIHERLERFPVTRTEARRRVAFAVLVVVLFVVAIGVAWGFADDGVKGKGKGT